MLRIKIPFVLLSGFLTLTWVMDSQAAPITFTFIKYQASANAQEEGVPFNFVKVNYPGDDPPIRASASIGDALAWAEAELKGDPPIASSLFASIQNAGLGYHGSVHGEFFFTATFPQISLSYNYKSECEYTKYLGSPAGFFLRDDTAVTTSFSRSYYMNSEDSVKNVLINLIPGHNYGILAIVYVTNGNDPLLGYEGVRFSASASLTDIDIQAIPLPPSLLFFGSGLLGLWAWRRRKLH